MLDSLITSKTRLQLLMRFFLNPDHSSYLRKLAAELGESTNGVRVELNRLEEARLLVSRMDGRHKLYAANRNHPLFPEINSIVKKTLGLNRIIDEIVANLGQLNMAMLVGDCARGIDSGVIELIIVGHVDLAYLEKLVIKAETVLQRRIRTVVLNQEEYANLAPQLIAEGGLILWGDGLQPNS
ncbi:ArsR family transcriptional regulator [Heliobacterium undosum]|uniref:ArsR family transcriptional regulator n=1 Tax=Heliomicrobium undosum TaxID=121734 RepID=A0A845L328_9FIRM|nr:winged helix-turn-helix domain-containing protein [Heliomicrobium undosum]MZP29519.1 ArsR family transcriptional regulator [Heliomicrobium undosum]